MTPTADAVKANAAAVTRAARPDPEVVATAKRRQFSGAEKRRILVRYRGLAKNTAQLHTLFALANLLIAKRQLLAVDSRGAS